MNRKRAAYFLHYRFWYDWHGKTHDRLWLFRAKRWIVIDFNLEVFV